MAGGFGPEEEAAPAGPRDNFSICQLNEGLNVGEDFVIKAAWLLVNLGSTAEREREIYEEKVLQ